MKRARLLRVTFHRAREKFAALLLAEVAKTLDDDSDEELQREMKSLGLMPYCQSVFTRQRP